MAWQKTTHAAAAVIAVAFSLMASTAFAQAPPEGDTDLSLTRTAIARSIEQREPQGTEGPFAVSDARVFLFLEVANPTRAEQVLTVVWQMQGSDRAVEQEISIGDSGRWRTWCSLRLNARRAGSWHVEVKTATGQLLGSQDFIVR